ncbi:MAG: hypothetical protein JSW19_04065 [Candidatus Bathyarchaeota archaeon]|nr:MAG: hypothetical protein JSW19_04065 [Candidatus Bathyarchaeota archaeon]
MKKLLKSRKALSPVVAAIILIAVTVAVSIAVAAWMGALTFTFMSTEQLEVQGATFGGTASASDNTITLSVQNTGTADLTVASYKLGVGGTAVDIADVEVLQGATGSIVCANAGWDSGTTYDIYLLTSTGKQFPYRATAP